METNENTTGSPNQAPNPWSSQSSSQSSTQEGAPAKKPRKPRRQKAVIDRIEEGKYAVLLVGKREVEKVVPVEHLPQGAGAGSWLKVRVMPAGVTDMLLDEEETMAAQTRVRSKLEMLRSRQSAFTPLSSSRPQNGDDTSQFSSSGDASGSGEQPQDGQ